MPTFLKIVARFLCRRARAVRPIAAAVLAAVALTTHTPIRAQTPSLADEAAVNAFSFADENTGLAVGEAGLVLRTDDAGRSWQTLSSGTPLPLMAVAMIDRNLAFVAGGSNIGFGNLSVGTILKTSDGGRSWQPIETPPAARFWGLAVQGKTIAAWGEPSPRNPAALLVSNDMGNSWRAVQGAVSAPVLTLRWTDDQKALAITADGAAWHLDALRLTRLDDQTPPGRITAAHVFDHHSWIVALETGSLVRTVDAGRSWRNVGLDGTPGGAGVRAFAFHEPGEGWLVGVGPCGVQFTGNAGLTWSVIGPLPPGPLRAIWFRDAWNGVVAGPFGSIYRTTDGGGRWTPAHHAPRRAALCVVAPYGSIADWPLVGMLAADRGYRSLLWTATRPLAEPLIVHERRLRDAAWTLAAAEAVVLPAAVSSRIEGPPAFVAAESPLPAATFNPTDPAPLTDLVRQVIRQWQPAAVLAPAPAGFDAEDAWVGDAVADAAKDASCRLWQADPLNRTGDRLPDIDGDFPITVNTLSPSETFGTLHAARAHMAAQLVFERPLPIAEALGYRRVGAELGDDTVLALAADLDDADAACRRDIGAVAAVALKTRTEWQRAAREFYPLFRADLDQGRLDAALSRATEFVDRHGPTLHIGQIALSAVARRAAVAGNLPSAQTASRLCAALSRDWPPRRLHELVWMLDLAACRELGGLPALPPGAYDLIRKEIQEQAPAVLDCDSLTHQWLRHRETSHGIEPAEAIALRAQLADSPDPTIRQLVALAQWSRADRPDRPPVAVVRLGGSRTRIVYPARTDAPQPDRADGSHNPPAAEQARPDNAEQEPGQSRNATTNEDKAAEEIDKKDKDDAKRRPAPDQNKKDKQADDKATDSQRSLDLGGVQLEFREADNRLYILLDAKAAEGLWLTIDFDGDGRTLLAEPLLDRSPPEQALLVTPTAPVWIRRPPLWSRLTRDGRLALGLSYEALGGRPAPRTVWLVTLRRHVADGLRPLPLPSLPDEGAFAVTFD